MLNILYVYMLGSNGDFYLPLPFFKFYFFIAKS